MEMENALTGFAHGNLGGNVPLDALAEQLQEAVKAREEALAELESAKLESQKVVDSFAEELHAVIKHRDHAIEETARLKEELNGALAQLALLYEVHERQGETHGLKEGRKCEVSATLMRNDFFDPTQAKNLVIGRDTVMESMPENALPTEPALRQLAGEAHLVGRLLHPNIPPIYEAGVDAKGRPFYTMRAPEGATLRQILNEMELGKTRALIHFTLRRMLSIFQRVCDAVAFAHSREMLHRNLKPENIVVGDYGEVFVTGWDAALNGECFAGSRAAGSDLHPDIAALGKILYEIMTLTSPADRDYFGMAPTAGDGRFALFGCAKSRGPGAMAYETLLGAAKRAMARQSHNGYHSVREFQRDVDTYKESFDDPTETLPLSKIFGLLFAGHKWAFGAVAVIFLILALLVVELALKLGTPAAEDRREALVAQDRMELDRITANDGRTNPAARAAK